MKPSLIPSVLILFACVFGSAQSVTYTEKAITHKNSVRNTNEPRLKGQVIWKLESWVERAREEPALADSLVLRPLQDKTPTIPHARPLRGALKNAFISQC